MLNNSETNEKKKEINNKKTSELKVLLVSLVFQTPAIENFVPVVATPKPLKAPASIISRNIALDHTNYLPFTEIYYLFYFSSNCRWEF